MLSSPRRALPLSSVGLIDSSPPMVSGGLIDSRAASSPPEYFVISSAYRFRRSGSRRVMLRTSFQGYGGCQDTGPSDRVMRSGTSMLTDAAVWGAPRRLPSERHSRRPRPAIIDLRRIAIEERFDCFCLAVRMQRQDIIA